MGRIASFHLATVPPGRAAVAMARLGLDRRRLPRVPGLAFWRLLGTGRGDDTGPSADPRRTAMFAVWEDEDALDRFLRSPEVVDRLAGLDESWSVRLRGVGGHGRWRGVDVLAGLAPGRPDGPIAVVTRAHVHARSWRAFRAAGRAVADEVRAAPGLLAVVGIGEAPVGRLGTFSLWRRAADLEAFARDRPAHVDAVRRTRSEHWYGEELFARFEPYGATGTWSGQVVELD
jgi:quinol monooxygenase YgiN